MSPRATMRVRITDKGVGSTARELFGKREASVTVGVFGEKGDTPVEGSSEGGLTVADLAEIHEFGLGVPERSFIRSFFDAEETTVSGLLMRLMREAMVKAIQTGKAISDGEKLKILNKIGLYCVGQIQGRIGNGDITPGLAQSTIDRKGSSTPLVDTGQLRSSITHKAEIK